MQIYRSELSKQFIDLFRGTFRLSEEEFEYVLQYFHREFIPKKDFYLKAGQISNRKAFINKGSTRNFVMDDKGGEHILFFAFEDWWVADYESFHSGKPCKQYIQAVEDCELLNINKTDFEKLCAELPKVQQGFMIKQQRMAVANLNRLNEVKSLSSEERYLELIQKHPHIFQRIPLQYIASYLDIEPQSLSRMRKRLMSK